MSKSRFYIVTPSYNQDKFLIQTINSVLRQRGDFDIHYFVMDGSSRDKSKDILKIYKSKLKFVSKKDKGQSSAINNGIKQILKNKTRIRDNDYFAFINSDDYYLPNIFRLIDEEFKNKPKKQWLIGDCNIVNQSNGEIQKPIKFYKKLFRYFPLNFCLKILNPVAQPATFIKLKAVKKLGLFDEKLKYTMDYDYWLRLIREFGEPIKLDQNLSAFRIHESSKGSLSFDKQFDEQLEVAKKYSDSSLLLTLQLWHNNIIKFIYKRIK